MSPPTPDTGTGAGQTRRPLEYEMTFDVEGADIDAVGHVNNVVYLRWVNAIAGAHWRHRADPERVRDTQWVVVRHEIDYLRAALPGDTVAIRTWVGDATRTRWDRHTEIRREGAGTDEILVRARSVWCPLDPDTGRPRRVTPEIIEPFFESEGAG